MRWTIAWPALLTTCALTLAACSEGPIRTTSVHNGQAGSRGATTEIDPCTLVTRGEIEDLLEGAPTNEPFAEEFGSRSVACEFRRAYPTATGYRQDSVTVTIVTRPLSTARFKAEAGRTSYGGPAERVEGIGDLAYWETIPGGNGTLSVLSGSTSVVLQLVLMGQPGRTLLGEAKVLGRSVLERLGTD